MTTEEILTSTFNRLAANITAVETEESESGDSLAPYIITGGLLVLAGAAAGAGAVYLYNKVNKPQQAYTLTLTNCPDI